MIGHDQRYQDASSETSSGLFGLHGLSGTPNSRAFQRFLPSDWSDFEQSPWSTAEYFAKCNKMLTFATYFASLGRPTSDNRWSSVFRSRACGTKQPHLQSS